MSLDLIHLGRDKLILQFTKTPANHGSFVLFSLAMNCTICVSVKGNLSLWSTAGINASFYALGPGVSLGGLGNKAQNYPRCGAKK